MNKIRLLQKQMKKDGIDFLILDTFDPHGSEYINDYYKLREFFSSFTGSNGVLLVTQTESFLWTDGRYFIQAENELTPDTKLMKMGEKGYPTLNEFLKKSIKKGNVIGFDGYLISALKGKAIKEIADSKHAFIRSDVNYADIFWKDRPMDSCAPAFVMGPELSGETFSSKLSRLGKYLSKEGNPTLVVSKLDDICWLFNIRGNDILCNPVCYSYAVIEKNSIHLFLKNGAADDSLKSYFKNNNIILHDYYSICDFLMSQKASADYIFDSGKTSYRIFEIISTDGKAVHKPSYIEKMKAVKNKTEIKNLKECYLKDSLCLTLFIKYMQEHAADKLTEAAAAKILDERRSRLDGFMELSFPTISAYGANAAMMHYEPTEDKCDVIENKGLYLVDSGGQYINGTTDVTRTLVMGEISQKVKQDFTKACAGMLRLMNCKFIKGCTGRNLDIIAREPLWALAMDYKCGTGHGIGFVLNVHEGPHNISWHKRADMFEEALVPGMIVSDEPGVYIEGKYGIRTENILLVTKFKKTSDGEFYGFEPLTLVPVDLRGIDISSFNDEDIALLNKYHSKVYRALSPYMNEEEKKWLKTQTRPL